MQRDLVFPPVLTKRDFARRYKEGEFGNRSPTWDTVQEFIQSGYVGLTHLRNKVAGGATYYNLSSAQLVEKWMSVSDPGQWYASAMAPHDRGTIQGELTQGGGVNGSGRPGVDLIWATAKKPMRDALRNGARSTSGIAALILLRMYMDRRSYDWLEELLDRYPGHVIEFTCFDSAWGTIPGYNTVIWEVRLY